MKHLIAIALLAPTLASAAFFDGNKLHEMLNSTENNRQLALWFVAGVHDAGEDIFFCAPGTSKLGQLTDIVKKTLIEEPELRHLTAGTLVIYSIGKAFPCAKKPTQGKTF